MKIINFTLQVPYAKDPVKVLENQVAHFRKLYIQMRQENESLRKIIQENNTSQHSQSIERQPQGDNHNQRFPSNSNENGKLSKNYYIYTLPDGKYINSKVIIKDENFCNRL